MSTSLARFLDDPVRGAFLVSVKGGGLAVFFGFAAAGGTADGDEGFEPILSLSFGKVEPGEATASAGGGVGGFDSCATLGLLKVSLSNGRADIVPDVSRSRNGHHKRQIVEYSQDESSIRRSVLYRRPNSWGSQ